MSERVYLRYIHAYIAVCLCREYGKNFWRRLQNFYHLVRIVQRVHRRVGEKPCANHGEREAAQVNSPVGKLLSQLRGDARPVKAHDSNGMEGMRNVKTHLRGCSD